MADTASPTSPTPSPLESQVHNILYGSLGHNAPHIKQLANLTIYQTSDNSDKSILDHHILRSDRGLQSAIGLHKDPATKKVGLRYLDHFTQDVADRLHSINSKRADPLDPSLPADQKIITQTINQVSQEIRRNNPLYRPVFNKQTVSEVSRAFIEKAALEDQKATDFHHQLTQEIHQNWSEHLTPQQRKDLVSDIEASLTHDSYTNPGLDPREQIFRAIDLHTGQYSSQPDYDPAKIYLKAQETAQNLGSHARNYQHQQHLLKTPAERKTTLPKDAFFALGQNKSPLRSAKNGILRRTFRDRSVDHLTKSVANEDLDKHIPTDQKYKDIDQKRAALRQQIYSGIILYEQGIDEGWLNNFDSAISNRLGDWTGSPDERQQHLQKVRDLTQSRRTFETLKNNHPDAVSRYTKFWSGANTPKRLLGKFDRRGWHYTAPVRYKAARARYNQTKYRYITRPLKVVYRPFIAADNFVTKYNPINRAGAAISNRVKDVRGRIGGRIMSKGINMVSENVGKKGARAAVSIVGGKLLVKLGAAASGVGTAFAVLSLAKDLAQLAGGKDALKKIFYLGVGLVSYGIAGAASLLAKLSGLLGYMLSFGLAGAGIGAALTALGFGVGALPGFIIGSLVGAGYYALAQAGLVASLAAIPGAIAGAAITFTAAATNLAGGIIAAVTNFLAVPVTVVTVGGAAVATGGLTGTYWHDFTTNSMINTLRVHSPYVLPLLPENFALIFPINGYLCWPFESANSITSTPAQHAARVDDHGRPATGTASNGMAYDISMVEGTPIFTPFPGTVTSAGWDIYGYGYKVIVTTDQGFDLVFAHLSKVTVSKGPIAQNQQLGESGDTGNSSGPHLHYEARGVDIRKIVPGSLAQLCLSNEDPSSQDASTPPDGANIPQ